MMVADVGDRGPILRSGFTGQAPRRGIRHRQTSQMEHLHGQPRRPADESGASDQ
jgi:hypothetical protein